MQDEGNFLVFGDTEKKNHSLIVVVGREPNNSQGRSVEIDYYAKGVLEGEKWPGRVQFWNNSYGLLGRYVGMSAAELKRICTEKRSSPIAFTDASPVALDGKYSPATKRKIRSQLTPRQFEEHVEGVFSHKAMFERTRLVIIAGVKGTELNGAVAPIEAACDTLGIPCSHVHSMSSRLHRQSDRMQQLAEQSDVIVSTMTEFLSQPDVNSLGQAA